MYWHKSGILNSPNGILLDRGLGLVAKGTDRIILIGSSVKNDE